MAAATREVEETYDHPDETGNRVDYRENESADQHS